MLERFDQGTIHEPLLEGVAVEVAGQTLAAAEQ